MSSVISLRIDDNLNEQLSLLIEATKKTKPALITEAIQAYLEHHREYIKAVEESIQEVETGLSLSHTEVKAYWKDYFENNHADKMV